MSLVGKFALISGKEYYQEIEIIERLTDDLYLIKNLSVFDENIPNIFLIHIGMLISEINNVEGFNPSVYLFDTEEKLKNFITYIESTTDQEKKVLTLVKKEV